MTPDLPVPTPSQEDALTHVHGPHCHHDHPHPAPAPYIAPPKIGRNDPCPCGSGKKYKACCLSKAQAADHPQP